MGMGVESNLSGSDLARTCVLGGAGTGKTGRLVRRAAELARAGVGSDVLVLAASPDAAATFAGRLAAELGTDGPGLAAAGVRVTTPRALELELLDEACGCGTCTRRARLLLPFEENILLEDVKGSGVRPKRLREMLKFFYRSWTELADDDPAWLVSEEEMRVLGLLKECLAFSGGVLEPELASLAVHVLRADEGLRASASAEHVLVDDYQLLSRASQELAGMLARASLTVAGDVSAAAEVFESYPFAAGLQTFAQAPGTETVRLEGCLRSRAVARCCDALRAELGEAGACAEGGASGEEGRAETRSFATPEEEIAFVARRVREAVAAGEQVFVAVPNGVWAKAVSGELGRLGVGVARRAHARVLGGDVRDVARCPAARAFTLLALAADERDSLAWRSWCGFGDWLAESPGFAALRRLESALGACGALEALAVGELPCEELDAAARLSLERVARSFKEGRAALESLRGLTGAALVEAAWKRVLSGDAEPVPAGLLELLGAGVPDVAQDARGLVAHALANLACPRFSPTGAPVRVGGLANVHGTAPDLLVFIGFVDGFMPRHAYFDLLKTPLDRQPALHAADVRRVYQALGCARRDVLITSFTGIEAARAERLDLKVERIYVRDGVRRARIAPSELIGALGSAVQGD